VLKAVLKNIALKLRIALQYRKGEYRKKDDVVNPHKRRLKVLHGFKTFNLLFL
jgi:hypothetical protein